jgi:hypothetical protein
VLLCARAPVARALTINVPTALTITVCGRSSSWVRSTDPHACTSHLDGPQARSEYALLGAVVEAVAVLRRSLLLQVIILSLLEVKRQGLKNAREWGMVLTNKMLMRKKRENMNGERIREWIEHGAGRSDVLGTV